MFKKIKQNGRRLIIVGDVHGSLTKLLDALASVKYSVEDDILVFTGDLIDRGKENAATLEWVSSLLKSERAYAVLGNHDDFMVEWADAYLASDKLVFPEHSEIWMRNGGAWAKELPMEWLVSHAAWMRELPLMIEIELDSGHRTGVVHAELWHPWGTTADIIHHNGIKERLIWGRSKIYQFKTQGLISTTAGVDMLFCGHSVVNAPTKVGNQYYLDTGAVFDKLYDTEERGAFSFGIIQPNATKPTVVKCLT